MLNSLNSLCGEACLAFEWKRRDTKMHKIQLLLSRSFQTRRDSQDKYNTRSYEKVQKIMKMFFYFLY